MSIDRALRKLNKLSDYIGGQRGIARLAIIIGNELVARTPVDTGAARSNWYLEIDYPATTFDKDKIDGSLAGRSLNQLKNFREIYITNNAPYIIRLNEGHSVQAPSGFIQAGVLRGIEKFTQVIQGDINRIDRGSD